MKLIKGLNELRFIAAFGVLVHHLELYKQRDKMGSLYNTVFKGFIHGLGPNMVYFFFVLSGFLITLLLLKEKNNTNKIDIRKFYIRRVLRIWPLYYFVLLLSFLLPYLVVNNNFFKIETYYYNRIVTTDYFAALPYFILFLSNIALVFGYKIAGAAQSWSVSVEEQFYVFWPWVIKVFYKVLPKFLIPFILIKVLVLNQVPRGDNFIINKLTEICNFIPIEYMAIGALGAFYAFKKEKFFYILFKDKRIALIVILVLLVLLAFNLSGIVLGFVFVSILSIIFVNQGKLEKTRLSYLGVISYGIYMYHPLVMFIVFACLNNLMLESEHVILYNILLYFITTFLTLLVSHLSYKYFEKYFLKFKDSFATVKINPKLNANEK